MIGTSGGQYRHWRGTCYPEKLAARRWLGHYAARFATFEFNNTFYRLPTPATFGQWAEQSPEDVVQAVKMSRYLTHHKRLHDPAEPVARSARGHPEAAALGPSWDRCCSSCRRTSGRTRPP